MQHPSALHAGTATPPEATAHATAVLSFTKKIHSCLNTSSSASALLAYALASTQCAKFRAVGNKAKDAVYPRYSKVPNEPVLSQFEHFLEAQT